MPRQSTEYKDGFIEKLPPGLEPYVIHAETEKPNFPYVKYGFWGKAARFLIMVSPFGWFQSLFRNHVVNEGQIGLIWENSKPKLLPPGRHVLLNPTTTFMGIHSVTEPTIEHGPIQLINVREGQLAYVLDSQTGKMELLTAGQHLINSPTRKFQKFIDLNKSSTELGSLNLVRIETGQVGIAYNAQGELNIIQPGIHVIAPPNRFKGIASTQQQILELPSITFKAGDNVPLNIKADVFYTIKEPTLAFAIIENVTKYIRDLAIATLGGIIQNSTIADVGQSSKPTYSEDKVNPKTEPSKTFSCKVHDAFIQQLQDHTLHTYGIDISNIRIETLNIADDKLAQQLSQQAVTRAKADADLANIEAQNSVRLSTSENEAKQAEAIARGQATACTAAAEAEAKAIVAKAKATAEARELEGAAEAKAQEALNNAKFDFFTKMAATDTGREILLVSEQAKALGPKSIIYTSNSASILSTLGLLPALRDIKSHVLYDTVMDGKSNVDSSTHSTASGSSRPSI